MNNIWKIEKEGRSVIVDDFSIVKDELVELSVGESVKITVVQLTDEEYNSLPEFTGW